MRYEPSALALNYQKNFINFRKIEKFQIVYEYVKKKIVSFNFPH